MTNERRVSRKAKEPTIGSWLTMIKMTSQPKVVELGELQLMTKQEATTADDERSSNGTTIKKPSEP